MTTEQTDTLPSIEDRVTELRAQLASVKGRDAVMFHLANADFATLRAFEEDFSFLTPTPITTLRAELADAYLHDRGDSRG